MPTKAVRSAAPLESVPVPEWAVEAGRTDQAALADVGLGGIVALEQQWLAGESDERVGERVADVQTGRVAAPPEAMEDLAGDLGPVAGEWSDLDCGLVQNSSRSWCPRRTRGFR